MEIKNKNFLVYGAGTSGISAYKFLQQNGANVYIYADNESEQLAELNCVKNFSDILNLNINYAVISPGVQIIGNKNIQKLKGFGILLISELELGYLFCKGKFIAVTGTNGKTTCVSLLGHILSKKFSTFVCGNIGVPITSICDKTNEESIVVCEVSSFMLELTSPNFAPDISIITNITPDHIARHKTFAEYFKTKTNITNFQTKSQFLIVDQSLNNLKTNAQKIIASVNKKYKTNLIGLFNQQNIAMCEQVCKLLGVEKKQFLKNLKTFSPVKFRLQNLGKKNGITYINDSKSTNPDSTVCAINSIKKNVIVLLGGSDKGNDFYNIFKQKNIKKAIVYGQTANKIEHDASFVGFKNIVKYQNLKEALNNLKTIAKRGDIVLLSPACASYDEFNNYVQRGEFFNCFVKEQ